jgi:hypothetical protein
MALWYVRLPGPPNRTPHAIWITGSSKKKETCCRLAIWCYYMDNRLHFHYIHARTCTHTADQLIVFSHAYMAPVSVWLHNISVWHRPMVVICLSSAHTWPHSRSSLEGAARVRGPWLGLTCHRVNTVNSLQSVDPERLWNASANYLTR